MSIDVHADGRTATVAHLDVVVSWDCHFKFLWLGVWDSSLLPLRSLRALTIDCCPKARQILTSTSRRIHEAAVVALHLVKWRKNGGKRWSEERSSEIRLLQEHEFRSMPFGKRCGQQSGGVRKKEGRLSRYWFWRINIVPTTAWRSAKAACVRAFTASRPVPVKRFRRGGTNPMML